MKYSKDYRHLNLCPLGVKGLMDITVNQVIVMCFGKKNYNNIFVKSLILP